MADADHNRNWERLCEFVVENMGKKGVPGVAIGVLHGDEVHTAGFGVTNIEHPLDVTDKTLFQIGSITKTFTGTVLMRLAELGKLDLDATVRTYIPEFRLADETAASRATIRHLLTHMGGWVGDFFHDTGSGADALPKYVADMADLEQLAPINTVWSYNNSGFYLAGCIIEAVTEKRYEAVVEELVLEPLEMSNSFFAPGDVITHRIAVGHNLGDEGPTVARPWPLPRAAWPAGGITCDVQDLLRYARFHLGNGKTNNGQYLLATESIAAMQSIQTRVWGDESWGLTWSLKSVNGTKIVGHGGGTVGQVSLLALVPEHDFAIAVFTNANSGGLITDDVANWVLREYLGLERQNPEAIQATEDELAQYTGFYSRPFLDVELGILGGRLIGAVSYKGGFPSRDVPPPPPPPPVSLGLCDKDRLIVLDGMMKNATADVVRAPDSSIGWLRFSGRIHRRQA
jgi:CubicO group peptidase (beta-lactamase class C family)